MKRKAQKPARRIPGSTWQHKPDIWKGLVAGESLDSDVTLVFFATDDIGSGPGWHVHPYDEIFIIRSGRALFTIGEHVVEAEAGDVLMGPAAVPHKYRSLGPGRLETTDIHLSREWIQTDLVDPDDA